MSLAVTTEAGGAVAEAPATDGIINGFRAGAPGSNQPAAPQPPRRAAAAAAPRLHLRGRSAQALAH